MYLFCPATISLPDIYKNKVVVVVVVRETETWCWCWRTRNNRNIEKLKHDEGK